MYTFSTAIAAAAASGALAISRTSEMKLMITVEYRGGTKCIIGCGDLSYSPYVTDSACTYFYSSWGSIHVTIMQLVMKYSLSITTVIAFCESAFWSVWYIGAVTGTLWAMYIYPPPNRELQSCSSGMSGDLKRHTIMMAFNTPSPHDNTRSIHNIYPIHVACIHGAILFKFRMNVNNDRERTLFTLFILSLSPNIVCRIFTW